MSRLRRIEKSNFLGTDFLLWCWFRSEQQNGMFSLEKNGKVEVVLEDKIVLEPIFGDGNKNSLSGVTPATSPEASVALQFNKVPSSMKLKVIQDAKAWTFTMKSNDLQIRGLKIPEVLAQTEEEQLYERIYLWEEIEAIWEELFEFFLKLRMSPRWTQEIVSIKEWIQEKIDEIQLLLPKS